MSNPVDPDTALAGSALAEAAPGIRRPRYLPQAPLLWRGPGQLQIGEGPHHVILEDVTPEMARWLLGLDGLRDVGQLAATLPIDVPLAARMLQAAFQAAALSDAATIPHAWRWADRATREASQPDHLAAMLTHGSGELADALIDQRLGVTSWVRGEGRLADEVRAAFDASGMPAASVESSATLVVLADSGHPVISEDPGLARPHLFIGAFGDRALIGPLVIPGHSSCLRCSYLHTRDADPHWPSLSLQLSAAIRRMPVLPIDRLHARLAACHGALLARTWVDRPDDRSAWMNRAIEIRLPAGTRVDHQRPWHPLCGCGWAELAS